MRFFTVMRGLAVRKEHIWTPGACFSRTSLCVCVCYRALRSPVLRPEHRSSQTCRCHGALIGLVLNRRERKTNNSGLKRAHFSLQAARADARASRALTPQQLAEARSHGGHMALPVPPHRHRGLHGGQVVSDPAVHGGSLRPGVRPHRGRGFLLPAGGDRAREADQAADLGHRGAGALQVRGGDSLAGD
ncbi:hypothetical protein AMECASPLE_000576 [Ameca splendens]|uniref:Uncharacterized protein n=1 Tax=Ameca splendens TaxID=208324 RepID=A0ABV0XXS4_9TELE